MFPNIEVRHLHAVIVLGEELNFTRAAHRLHLSQSALRRQIAEIEKQHGVRLFIRDNRRVVRVELTDEVWGGGRMQHTGWMQVENLAEKSRRYFFATGQSFLASFAANISIQLMNYGGIKLKL